MYATASAQTANWGKNPCVSDKNHHINPHHFFNPKSHCGETQHQIHFFNPSKITPHEIDPQTHWSIIMFSLSPFCLVKSR
jgi:hypothetical protein